MVPEANKMTLTVQEVASELIYLKDLAKARGECGIALEASEALAEMEQMRFNVSFIGQFKRGKSSLINAIVGRELLPVDIAPITSAITVLQHGDTEQCRVLYQDGRAENVPLDQISFYVSEDSNPGNHKAVREVLITLPLPLLAEGIRLVDTPGVGSIIASNDEVTRNFLPKIDLAIVVLGTDPPISGEEINMVRSLVSYADRMIFVLNKSDLACESALNKTESFTRRALNEVLGNDPGPLLRLSAKRAMVGNNYQVANLIKILRTTAQDSRPHLAAGSARRASSHLAGRLLWQVKLERAALEAPLSELDLRIARFEAATRDVEDLMLAAFTRTKSEMVYDWKTWSEERAERIEAGKKTAAAGVTAKAQGDQVGKRKIREAISGFAREEIALFLEHWRGYVGRWVEDRYHSKEERVKDETNRLLARVADAAIESFGIELVPFETKLLKLDLGKISSDLSSAALALDPEDWIIPVLVIFLPRPLVIKMSLRRAKEQMEEWLQRNIYQIDEKVTEWLDEATRQLFNSMQSQFETMRQEVMNALVAGKKQKETGVSAIADRLAELKREEQMLSTITKFSTTRS
jgi:GTP-binding protein EngB required for normal cell division